MIKDLDYYLDEISVMDNSEDWVINLDGWYAVCNEEGIIAYFRDENEALGFRLNYINHKMNYENSNY